MADVSVDERQALVRADKAKTILEHDEFTNAVQAVRAEIANRFSKAPIRDTEGMLALRLQLKCLDDVIANLHSVVNTGKVIQERITWRESLKRKARNVLGR